MRKFIVVIVLCLAPMLLTRCAKKPSSSYSTSAAEIAEMKKKYSSEQLSEGKMVFENNCGKCHRLRQPAEFTVKAWDRILPKMVIKSKLNAEQSARLRAWVLINAKA